VRGRRRPVWGGWAASSAANSPALHCMSIDLDASEKTDAVEALVAELLAKGRKARLPFGMGQRLVPRLND